MYTQCPDCEVTFKVTAEVLQQARGRVRCGNCGEAFNALDHLSESPPLPQTIAPQDPESERKSQELLNTLNQMAGPNEVRIEDTGIEWRVMEEDSAEGAADTDLEEPAAAPDEAAAETSPENKEEELRYDDNTPLPDEFADEPANEGHLVYAETPESFEFTEPAETDTANELDLSEPDEWTDLLEEVEIGDENSPEAIEARGEAVPTDEPDASGDGTEGAAATDDEEAPADTPITEDVEDQGEPEPEPSVESAVPYDGQPGDEAAGAETEDEFEFAAEEDLEIEFDDDGDKADEAATGEVDEEPSEDGDGDALVAEEAGSEADIEDDADEEAHAEEADEHDELEWAAGEAAGDDESSDPDADDEFEEPAAVGAASEDEDSLADTSGEFERAIMNAEDEDDSGDADVFDDPVAADDDAAAKSDAEDEVADDIAAMTANMQSDPDVIRAMQEGKFDGAITNEDGSPMVETIIMEGDAVRDALEAADTGERRSLEDDDPASLLDTYISSRKPEKISAMPGLMMIVGSVVLALALGAQFIHSQRETLATQGWFANAVAPIYASLGMPVTPDWDIRGWQFEATSGSTGGSNGDLLTISSRVSNRSSKSLPYPLVHVSLTDRYQEVIGSRILQPGEYLSNGVNDGAVVVAGGNFTATITIADTSAEATGFNLNVCYPETGNRVRCAIEDFKER